MEQGAMRGVAYVSSATWGLGDDDLAVIVSESRGFNQAVGVTGVLLYCDGNFMHYFEGPDDAVIATYERILRSRRHHQVSELMNEPIEQREFGDWTMGFSRTTPGFFLDIAAARWPGPGELGPGATLVQVFWAHCRHPAV